MAVLPSLLEVSNVVQTDYRIQSACRCPFARVKMLRSITNAVPMQCNAMIERNRRNIAVPEPAPKCNSTAKEKEGRNDPVQKHRQCSLARSLMYRVNAQMEQKRSAE